MCNPVTSTTVAPAQWDIKNPCGDSGTLPSPNLTEVMSSLKVKAGQVADDGSRLQTFLTEGDNPWVTYSLIQQLEESHYSGFPYEFNGTSDPQANITKTLINDYVFLSNLHIFYEQLWSITDCSTRANKIEALKIINSILRNTKKALCNIDIYLHESGHSMPTGEIPTKEQVLNASETNKPNAPGVMELSDCSNNAKHNFIPMHIWRSLVSVVVARDTTTTCTILEEQYDALLTAQ
ncbi:hypothetical protein V1264_013269 [Littorina saxatilis]|uniref:Uncharacterized protein n=1 Tax=Littorina saxatilis TaxID=31220 RepID=A0AAN9BP83_9CAEN